MSIQLPVLTPEDLDAINAHAASIGKAAVSIGPPTLGRGPSLSKSGPLVSNIVRNPFLQKFTQGLPSSPLPPYAAQNPFPYQRLNPTGTAGAVRGYSRISTLSPYHGTQYKPAPDNRTIPQKLPGNFVSIGKSIYDMIGNTGASVGRSLTRIRMIRHLEGLFQLWRRP